MANLARERQDTTKGGGPEFLPNSCGANDVSKMLSLIMFSDMEVYRLKWERYSEALRWGLKEEKQRGDFSDVAVAVPGGHTLHAHKLVLATSSHFFRQILRENNHPYPLIFIAGMTWENLLKVVDFMYLGEVEMGTEDLDSFIEAAEMLQLVGLETEKSDSKMKASDKVVEENGREGSGKKQVGSKMAESEQEGSEKEETGGSEKEETGERQKAKLTKVMLQGAELNRKLEEFCLKTEEGDFACTECKKKFRKRRKLLFHAEIHLDLNFLCTLCPATTRTRNAMAEHCRVKHKSSLGNPRDM